ncbi:MAG: flagellar basal body L-ring protein FlgH [Proteobacteria bacterium]|nr:flagellar basal body L-ring protein FlgH [Pseudomonadota bacterium]MBU1581178.1 flagellar basal body L-ring protein FlgH [Pseudomonadota bacterium]MBU2454579.1 flagellar basal body L-ring protein FlgH [Pseudomonadota bacterium]MBU2629859.1 flagellar basal body L-ring protein FlgH [Pseudomonadota bacterium]
MNKKFGFKAIHVLSLFLFFMGVLGCSLDSSKNTAGLVIPEGASTEPGLQPEFSAPRPSEGSLWISKNSSMFEDSKATHVGDTVIVDIIENSTSKMDVNTESSRKTAMDIGMPTMNLFGDKKIFGGAPGATKILGTDFTNSFAGEATSDRSGQVTASIAARVTEVLPNGNLSLFGRRAMKVNNEVQYITVSGIIRPQDVSASNRVKSTYLADSRIEYYGKGALADKQKPGWGTRIIDNLWPW